MILLKRLSTYGAARVLIGIGTYAFILACLYGMSTPNYSLFSNAFAYVQLLATLYFGWIFTSIPVLVARQAPDDVQQLISSFLRIFAALSTLLLLCALAIQLGFTGSPLASMAVLIAAAAIGSSACENALAIANAQHLLRPYLIISLSRYSVAIVALLLFGATLGVGATTALGALTIGCAFALLMPSVRRSLAIIQQQRPIFYDFPKIMAVGLPALIAFGSYPIAISVGRIAVSYIYGLDAAAMIGGSNDILLGPLALAFQIFSLSLGPELMRAGVADDVAPFRRHASQLLGCNLLIALSGIVFLCHSGEKLADFMLQGRLGTEAPEIFVPLGISILLGLFVNGLAAVAIAAKAAREAMLSAVVVIVAVVALPLTWATTPVDFAWAFAMGWSAFAGIGFALLHFRLGVRLDWSSIRTSIVAGAMLQTYLVACEYAMPGGHILLIMVGAAAVLGATLLSLDFLGIRTTVREWLANQKQRKG